MSWRILVDLVLPPDGMDLMRAGTAGHELLVPAAPAASVLSKGKPDPQAWTADVIFGQPDPQVVAESKVLRWIHISSSGFTRYDNQGFRSLVQTKGIPVTNSASVYDEPCAVHLLSFILAQARQLPMALRSQSPNGTPEWLAIRESGNCLRGQTVLIVGFGAIARHLVALLQPLGLHVIAHRRQVRGDEGVPMVSLEELDSVLARDADHVVNILPESDQTRRFFDISRFQRMKPGSVFYNIGRGATVDQEALVTVLKSGHLEAAWLDVTDPEPLPTGHPLLSAPRCHITPHVAGGHTGEAKSLVRHFLRNLEAFSAGLPLQDRIM